MFPEKAPQQPENIEPSETDNQFRAFWDRNWPIFRYRMQEGYAGLKAEQSPTGTWGIDLEKEPPTIYFEPSYFGGEGFTPEQATFATLHEIGHWRDKLREPEIWSRELGKWKESKRRHHLVNSLMDIWDNTEVIRDFGSLGSGARRLYKEKLFPVSDLTRAPRHIQFIHAMLLSRMLPEDKFNFSPEVEPALRQVTSLRSRGKRINLLALISSPDLPQKEKFQIIERFIEPIYERLFEEDVKEQRQKGSGEGNGESRENGKGEGKEEKKNGGKGKEKSGKDANEQNSLAEPTEEPTNPEDYFKADYEEAKKRMIPSPITPEEEEKILDRCREVKEQKEKESEELKKKIETEAQRLGLPLEIVQDYYTDRREIEPLIKEMLKIVSRIVVERRKNKDRLVGPTKEGVLVDPVRAHIDFSSGKEETYSFRKIKGQPQVTKFVGAYDLHLVCDLSSSMAEGNMHKLKVQRKSALLVLETMLELDKEIKHLVRSGDINEEDKLAVRTETRYFSGSGDTKLKDVNQPLSRDGIVKLYAEMSKACGSTPDFLSLKNISQEITAEEEKALRENKRKKMIIVFSDGESDRPDLLQDALDILRQKKNVKVVGLGMDRSAYAIAENYQPYGVAVPAIEKMPEIVKDLFKEELDLLAKPISPRR